MAVNPHISIHNVTPADVTLCVFDNGPRRSAAIDIGHYGLHVAGATLGRELGDIARIGDRIAADARRAGHRYRTERRTAELANAVKAVA